MESFSYNAEGVKAAADYLKAQGRYDYIRQIVSKGSLDLIRFAQCIQQGDEAAFFQPDKPNAFRSRSRARHYLWYIGKLDWIIAVFGESRLQRFATEFWQGNGDAYIEKRIELDRKYGREDGRNIDDVIRALKPQKTDKPSVKNSSRQSVKSAKDVKLAWTTKPWQAAQASDADQYERFATQAPTGNANKPGLFSRLGGFLSALQPTSRSPVNPNNDYHDPGADVPPDSTGQVDSNQNDPDQSNQNSLTGADNYRDPLTGDTNVHETINQCKHCGLSFSVPKSEGYLTSMEGFTCDSCYRDGKRDWATDYHDESTF